MAATSTTESSHDLRHGAELLARSKNQIVIEELKKAITAYLNRNPVPNLAEWTPGADYSEFISDPYSSTLDAQLQDSTYVFYAERHFNLPLTGNGEMLRRNYERNYHTARSASLLSYPKQLEVAARSGKLDLVKDLWAQRNNPDIYRPGKPDVELAKTRLIQGALSGGHMPVIKYISRDLDFDIFRGTDIPRTVIMSRNPLAIIYVFSNLVARRKGKVIQWRWFMGCAVETGRKSIVYLLEEFLAPHMSECNKHAMETLYYHAGKSACSTMIDCVDDMITRFRYKDSVDKEAIDIWLSEGRTLNGIFDSRLGAYNLDLIELARGGYNEIIEFYHYRSNRPNAENILQLGIRCGNLGLTSWGLKLNPDWDRAELREITLRESGYLPILSLLEDPE